MIYTMTPHDFFVKIIELYQNARKPTCNSLNIYRGRSASISNNVEDLTALFIALNNPNDCKYFIDQPMQFQNSSYKYPDIVIQNTDGLIYDLVDVKTDIGWNRNGMLEFCKKWEDAIEKVRNTPTSFKTGINKQKRDGHFSETLHYHILVLSKINCGKNIEAVHSQVLKEFKNVSLYILSEKVHPNSYDVNIDVAKKITINNNEFERFFKIITSRNGN